MGDQFSCTVDPIYSLTDKGQLEHVAANGTVDAIGDAPKDEEDPYEAPRKRPSKNYIDPRENDPDFDITKVEGFDALGISNTVAYSLGKISITAWFFGSDPKNRGNDRQNDILQYRPRDGSTRTAVTVWTNAGTGWTNTEVEVPSNVLWTGGAVNLRTGTYIFGGYGANDGQFHLYEYDPGTKKVTEKGSIAIPDSNGDMAFDRQGNLFIVGGSSIYVVRAADYAQGGQIPFTTMKLGFQAGTSGLAYDELGQPVTSVGADASDLASCGWPSTVMLDASFVAKVKNSDQVTLTLMQGDASSTVTTAGPDSGVQTAFIGPFPVIRTREVTFDEIGVTGTDLTDSYATSWTCDTQPTQKDDGTTGKVTVPSNIDQVTCHFVNRPKVHVTVTKKVLSTANADPQPASNWEMTITKPDEEIASVGDQALQQATDSDGTATWDVLFAENSAVTLTFGEVQQNGYQVNAALSSCTVIDRDNRSTMTKLDAQTGQIPDVSMQPGDTVNCTFVNTSPGTLQVTVAFDNTVPTLASDATFMGSYECMLNGQTVATGQWSYTGQRPGNAKLTPNGQTQAASNKIPAGAQCMATATQPNKGAMTGLPLGYVWNTMSVSASVVITSGQTQTITVTTSAAEVRGAISWTKTDGDGVLLGGSEWSLTGPEGFRALESITDCDEQSADQCVGPDKDPAQGQFRVNDLPWGAYTLHEQKAPSGYILKTEGISVTLAQFQKAGNNPVPVGPIRNDPRDQVTLPLTGGFGSDALYLSGGVLIAASVGVGTYIRRRTARSGAKA